MAKTILNFHFDYWNPSLKLQAENEDRSCKKKRSAPFGSFNANYQKATLYSGEEESLGQLTVWSEFEARPCNTG